MRRIAECFAILVLLGAAPSPAAADCVCRARGIVAKHGQTVCIPTPEGVRLARCGKVSNVASWTFLDAPCPQAAREVPATLSAARSSLPESLPIVR